MRLSAGTRLGPYEIVAPIGAGGMGEVYRARDGRLKREVAIKVLPASLSDDPDRLRRFEKEAQAASALNHPNIMAVFDIGSQDATSYIVTELLEGQTLRERLAEGRLAHRKAIEFAEQIASGLAAAHAKGIVHRDLKPENIFVTRQEHVKILDFGLAKLAEPEKGAGSVLSTASGATEPGVVLGTLAYMSPEQVKGQPLDSRSDIFSFGAVLYEMLTGQRAFTRGSAAETMSAILTEEPPELASGQNLPPALDHIVRHCLEKVPDRRFQSATDVAFSLTEMSDPVFTSDRRSAGSPALKRNVLVAVAVVAALAGAGALLRRSREDLGETGGVRRVVVLPFENLGSSEDDYFADGIADAIRGKLTSLPGVEVIARASSTPYKKTTKTQEQIGRELHARYLLTATVRWQKGPGGSRVQVSPELVELRESAPPASKWQEPFDAALTDVFQVQSEIASRVARSLGVALGAGDKARLASAPTRSLDAYDAFLKGEEVSNSLGADAVSARKALEFYERAVALDPGFARAWSQLSLANSIIYSQDSPTPERAEHALSAARKAIALDPEGPEGYRAFGAYQDFVVEDHVRALEEYEKARRSAPLSADLLLRVALAEMSLGRWEMAVAHLRQAERLDPRSVGSLRTLNRALVLLRRYGEAREVADRGLAIAPGNLPLIRWKVISFLGEGDLAGARAVLKTALDNVELTALVTSMGTFLDLGWALDERQQELLLRLPPSAFEDSRGLRALCFAQVYAWKGDGPRARAFAEEARAAFAEQPQGVEDDADVGLALAYLGRKEEAIRAGERAVARQPLARNADAGPFYQERLARIYALVGEPEKAVDVIARLLEIPGTLSPPFLRIDPAFNSLRKNPRFQKLVAGAK
jgi:TolB-like protein